MSRKQRYISLPPDQIDFIRDNADTMTQKEMARKFGCSQSKVCENAGLAGIIFPDRNPNKEADVNAVEGTFFDAGTDVMFGWAKGRNY